MLKAIKNWFIKPKQKIEELNKIEPKPYKRKFSEEEYQNWFIEYIPLTGYYFAKNIDDKYICCIQSGYVIDGIVLYSDLVDEDNRNRFAFSSKTKDEVFKAIDGYILYKKLSKPEIIKI